MADLVSPQAVRQISDIDAPFVVRIDIPLSLRDPETDVTVMPAKSPADAATRATLILAGVPREDTVQIRVWGDVDGERQLVFDRSVPTASASAVLAEFAAREIVAEPPLDEAAQQRRVDLGGPFDTDHALMLASARANLTS